MSNQIRCHGCGFNRPESEVVCLRCLTTCRIQLAELPKLHLLASAFILPGRNGSGGSGQKSYESKVPGSINAMDYRIFEILGILHEWQDLVRTELELHDRLPLRGTLEARVQNAVEFLQVHFEYIAHQADFAFDFFTEIKHLYGLGMQITQQTMPKFRQVECPADITEGVPCNRKLVIDETDFDAEIKCNRCKTIWSTKRLIVVLIDVGEYYLDSEAIAKYKGISTSQVNKILKAHEVPKVWDDQIGRYAYHFKKFLAAHEKLVSKAK